MVPETLSLSKSGTFGKKGKKKRGSKKKKGAKKKGGKSVSSNDQNISEEDEDEEGSDFDDATSVQSKQSRRPVKKLASKIQEEEGETERKDVSAKSQAGYVSSSGRESDVMTPKLDRKKDISPGNSRAKNKEIDVSALDTDEEKERKSGISQVTYSN